MEGEDAIEKTAVTAVNLEHLKQTLKKGVLRPPMVMELSKEPTVYRRDLVRNWIMSKPVVELNEVTELENLFVFLKGTIDDLQYQKYMEGTTGPPSPRELAYYKYLGEVLVNLNKMKYGERRTNVNVGFSYNDIQEMMLGVHKDDKV